ncbi:uncharacterized protein PAC_13448 [Phialocephala subalpina]|uniref:Secreted protein n=1 Tax=Phialocephala subalpina TaxID=576137 RepID=A0A1L7XEV1_9HELO|nr:uncharacterized protein PAC_13448 [Phialocephala subalpina]
MRFITALVALFGLLALAHSQMLYQYNETYCPKLNDKKNPHQLYGNWHATTGKCYNFHNKTKSIWFKKMVATKLWVFTEPGCKGEKHMVPEPAGCIGKMHVHGKNPSWDDDHEGMWNITVKSIRYR